MNLIFQIKAGESAHRPGGRAWPGQDGPRPPRDPPQHGRGAAGGARSQHDGVGAVAGGGWASKAEEPGAGAAAGTGRETKCRGGQ